MPMAMDIKPYVAMNDSGVPWLGKVPDHWEVRRLGQIGRLSKGTGGNKDDEESSGVPCVRYGDLYTTHTFFIRKSRSFVSPATARAYTPIRFGDVLFAASGETIDEIGKSAVNLIQSAACCGGDVILFRPKRDVDPRYMGYATDCRLAAAQKATMARGITVKHIYGDQLKYLTLALPPLPEQTAIARFLDHADRRLRRYIRAKQKLIKLLDEQKQAIIHRAVTRGLDPNVRLKPSGVAWLGDVPEHWEVWQIGHFASIGNGSTPSRGNMAYWSGGTFPWLNSSSVNAGTIIASDQFVTDTALRECHLPRVPAGSVLVAITGQGKTRGTAAVVTIETTINQHIAFITPRKQKKTATPHYLRAFLVAAYSELRRLSDDSGSTRGALTCEGLRHFRVSLPPVEEQERIVQWLRDATAEVEAALHLASREISLLREYCTRLIADVVAGKLDVREVAARLPDEVEEPETLEGTDSMTDGDEESPDDVDAAPEEAEA